MSYITKFGHTDLHSRINVLLFLHETLYLGHILKTKGRVL